MLKRQIVGVTGIILWTGLIAAAAIWAVKSRASSAEPTQKALQESGDEATSIEILAKDLVSALSSGDYKKATENFNGTMKKALPAEKLKEAWNSLITKSGPFVEQLGTRREKIMGYDVIFVTCKFEKGVLDTKVVFNNKQQVAGLFFVPSK
jgi:hypothetical protein